MKLGNICRVLALIKDTPWIPKEAFFRRNGVSVRIMPRAEALLDESLEGAIGVVSGSPIFMGDALWYHSHNYSGEVKVTSVDMGAEPVEYHFANEEMLDIIVAEFVLEEFIKIKKPQFKYDLISFNGLLIRKFSDEYTQEYPIKIKDGTGREYWVDSQETLDLFNRSMEKMYDKILAATVYSKVVRLIIAGESTITIVSKTT